jgi:DNA-binding NtrC family response regulator
LEARTVQPLGADRPLPVNVRIVAATHRSLRNLVDTKLFRFDLFFRLAVVHLRLPALRERPEDLAALIRNFYEGRGVDPGVIDGANLDALRSYEWPGNVRELRNVLERAWVLSGPTPRDFANLELWMGSPAPIAAVEAVDARLPFKEAKEQVVAQFERRYLAALLEQYGGNLSQAAKHAGINRNHLRELAQKLGLAK